VILNPSTVVAAGGIRVLVQCLADGPYELSDTVMVAFLYLLDMPVTRQYLRAGYDLDVSGSITCINVQQLTIVDRVCSFLGCSCEGTYARREASIEC